MNRSADIVDTVLESSIAPSFSRVGYSIRQRLDHWTPLNSYDLQGRVVVISGATSGIGFATSSSLLACGATLEIIGRDATRTNAAAHQLRNQSSCQGTVSVVVADTGDLEQITTAADELSERHASIDVLIHNAGALSAAYAESQQGIEQTVASQVVGPFALTQLLREPLTRSSNARVLWVSSGGMYSQALDVEHLEMMSEGYNGTVAYARAKRAQVTLNEMFPERWAGTDVRFHAMHPGWADTPGVQKALPTFRRLLRPFLRTPAEGADTLVWLACDDGLPLQRTGTFWLDRRVRSINKLRATRSADTPLAREQLWDWCTERARPYLAGR